MEALEHRQNGGAPDAEAVRDYLVAAAKSRQEEHPAVGLGRDVRFEADGLSGYALVENGGVLHAAAFAN